MYLEKFTDDSPMPFGQYKGQKLSSLPANYLLFLFRNDRAGRISDYIKENMEALTKKAKTEKKKRFRR